MGKAKDKKRQGETKKLQRLDMIARSRGLLSAGDLEERVDTSYHGYDEMRFLAGKYRVMINQIYGGYLRQPITVDDNSDILQVYGYCALLDHEPCSNTLKPDTTNYDACDTCPVYKARFNID